MAAREEGQGGLSARCISLLEEVKEIIEGSTVNNNTNVNETAAGRNVSTSERIQTDSSEPSQRVIQNFRSLFSPYASRCLPGPSSLARNNASRPPPAKKPKKDGFFKVKETWTHDLFCLASTAATCVPLRSDKISLQNAGLGRRKVVFPCRASAPDVKKVLEGVYPKLKESGGFELLRSGSPASMLSLITPPAAGYSVSFLRDAAGLGQALAYIRPLQKDLDTSVEITEEACASNAPTVQCLVCHTEIPMSLFRQHQVECATKEPETLATTDTSLELMKDAFSEDGASVSFESHLKEMFPEQTPENIQGAVLQGNLAGAVDYLLNREMGEKEDEDSSADWNVPLSAWGMRKLSNYQDALKQFVTEAVQSHAPEEHFTINRNKSIITQVLRKYKNPSFNIQSPLNIQFQSSGILELGVDAGGPTRAFFYHLMQELVRGNFNGIKLFEGEAGHLVPSCDYDLVSSCFFVVVGKMVVHSFIHECKGLEGISPAVISYIISGSRDTVLEHLVIEDIPDPCLRQILKELMDCTDQELGKFTSEGDFNIVDTLVAAGFPHIEVIPSNRLLAYECILTYEVVTKRVAVLDDLRKGLDSVRVMATSVTDLVQQHPKVQQLIFPAAESRIEVSELRQLIKYDPTDDSTEKAVEYFETYLDELYTRDVSEEEETIGGLLQFWTGWPSLPMMEEKIIVAFLAKTPNKVLPEADTCFKVLKIPTYHTEYNNFKKSMDLSISHGKVGFGKM